MKTPEQRLGEFKELMQLLVVVYRHKYLSCPEMEDEEGFAQRQLRSEGFVDAVKIVDEWVSGGPKIIRTTP